MSFAIGFAFNLHAPASAWVIVGAGLLYGGSRLAAEALAGRSPLVPGWRAIGHWIPIAAMALGAAACQRAELAMGVIFATSIGSLSLVMGLLLCFTSLTAHPSTRRAWPFVLPATLLPLIAGFSSRLSWIHALMMLGLGAAIWSVWVDPAGQGPAEAIESNKATSKESEARGGRMRLIGAILMSLIGAGVAIFELLYERRDAPSLPLSAVAVGVLSPVLTMPMFASGSALAQRGHASSMASTLVGIALLNVSVLLPACILTWYVAPGVTRYGQQVIGYTPADPTVPEAFEALTTTRPASTAPASTAPASKPRTSRVRFVDALLTTAQPMPYPLSVWRIDTVVLLLLGFVLVPVAIGRWTLGRAEAAGLIIGYAIYLAIVMKLSWK